MSGLGLRSWAIMAVLSICASRGEACLAPTSSETPPPSTLSRLFAALSSFFARFRLSGWKRLLNEAVAEGLTLGVGGLTVLYVLAIPAISEFDDDEVAAARGAVGQARARQFTWARTAAETHAVYEQVVRSPR